MLFHLDDGIQSIIMSDQYRMDDRIIYILYYTIGLYIITVSAQTLITVLCFIMFILQLYAGSSAKNLYFCC